MHFSQKVLNKRFLFSEIEEEILEYIQANKAFAQYKGELQIALVDTPNDGNVNVIGHIVEEEMFLLDIIEPGQSFKLKEK